MTKLPGKTTYSGIRRNTTRKSGFKSHPDSTGGEYKREVVTPYFLEAGKTLTICFQFPPSNGQDFIGFGGFFRCESFVQISFNNPNIAENEFSRNSPANTSKFGSMWQHHGIAESVTINFHSQVDTYIALYGLECGLIWHEAFTVAIENNQLGYLKSMHSIMPEAGFYTAEGTVTLHYNGILKRLSQSIIFHLKSCNRCARFLPINVNDERAHLCFSNHCVANAPCKHKGFGILTDIDSKETKTLHFGYQLECRFCKKYYVNMPLNWQRTAAQMKEDGQRRRNFELLIAEVNKLSPQLHYRIKNGRELLDDVWDRFNGCCFNCNIPLQNKQKMHLDHTRPLALLWPLDGTATALCATCNTKKRDRPPSLFYDELQLCQLSQLTGLSIDELLVPEPNHVVIAEILNRLDWFYEDFLTKPSLLMERDGKIAAELIVKALDKVLLRSKTINYKFSFVEEYNKRREKKITFDINEDTDSIV